MRAWGWQTLCASLAGEQAQSGVDGCWAVAHSPVAPICGDIMIRRLFKKASPSRPLDTARMPDGMRVYAIGDIHGRHDLLVQLLAQIEADMLPPEILSERLQSDSRLSVLMAVPLREARESFER